MAVLSQPRGTNMLALSRRLIACHLWRRRRGLVEDGLCEAHERSLPLGDVPRQQHGIIRGAQLPLQLLLLLQPLQRLRGLVNHLHHLQLDFRIGTLCSCFEQGTAKYSIHDGTCATDHIVERSCDHFVLLRHVCVLGVVGRRDTADVSLANYNHALGQSTEIRLPNHWECSGVGHTFSLSS